MTAKFHFENPWIALPNLLTEFRFIAAPFLLWLAWHGFEMAFLVLLAFVFFSDLLDGFTARLTGQVTPFGAKLDSWADVVTYLTIAMGCWWLKPGIIKQELFYFILVFASFLLPGIVAIGKFKCLTSYHTWAVKIAAASTGLSLFALFLLDLLWPFRLSSLICMYASIEEIIITFLLPAPQSNLRSVWHVLKGLRRND